MRSIKLLKNTVQNYAWGSPTAIPELLGEDNPTLEPNAELWMGAHPKAPSLIKYDGRWLSLADLIAEYHKRSWEVMWHCPLTANCRTCSRSWQQQSPCPFRLTLT